MTLEMIQLALANTLERARHAAGQVRRVSVRFAGNFFKFSQQTSSCINIYHQLVPSNKLQFTKYLLPDEALLFY